MLLSQTPPMGWNSWNTFGPDVNEKVVLDAVDFMVEKGYKDAGYEYIVIDDCWLLRDRDENDRLVPDPEKFPHGMKYVADYVHSKGLKFGMYSCAGTRTCARYPSSYNHEYIDAKTFAEWEIDFLKYDFCNFKGVDDKRSYLTMAQALRTCGRDILFSACQWGKNDPAHWMRSVGAHMYRSTGDINDTYESMMKIMIEQQDNFQANGAGCFNDIDMMTVGMYGKGLVARPSKMTYDEYEMQFAFWCFVGAPLMMGADLTQVDEECRKLMQHKELIRINQDKECRPPYYLTPYKMHMEAHATGWNQGAVMIYVRQLENNEYAVGVFNLRDGDSHFIIDNEELGVPFGQGYGVEYTDVITGEKIGVRRCDIYGTVKAHSCKVYRCKTVKL